MCFSFFILNEYLHRVQNVYKFNFVLVSDAGVFAYKQKFTA